MPLTRLDIWLPRLAGGNLAAVVLACVAILFVGDRWWLTTALAYLPRVPWAVPSLILLPVTAWNRSWWSVAACVLAATLIFGPLMGLTLGLGASEGGQSVTVATCNIQDAQPRLELVLRELTAVDPDVVCFQESSQDRPEFKRKWPEFHVLHEASFFVGSRWPIEPLGLIESDTARRWCGGVYRVVHPQRPFILVNVHLSTARHGLAHLRDPEVPLPTALNRLSAHQDLREGETFDLAAAVAKVAGEPVVLAGDFNQPPGGAFLSRAFGGWANAFDAAGLGYGYTAPCDTDRLWPTNWPWLRIDHVLVRPGEFGVRSAAVGRSAGSDHRLVTAELVWD